MSDLIDRQAAIDAIRADPMGGLNYARILKNMPTADVVEVVRCKDCAYKPYVADVFHASYGDVPVLESNGACPCINEDDYFYSHMPDDDWFCANGERRQESGEAD